MLLDWARRHFTIAEDSVAPAMSSRFGPRALELAISQIGKGEQGGNNLGPDLDRYRTGRDGKRGPGGAWCAAFGCWYLEGAGFRFRRSHSAKGLFAACLRAGAWKVDRPAPGDGALWHRGAKGAWTGHWAIVSDVAGRGSPRFECIEGNRGDFPSRIARWPHELGEANLLGFCRLP